MSFSNIFKIAACGILLLTAQQTLATPQDLPVKSISVPTYNMITDALQAITPTINGKRNDFAMQQICALARGEKTQQDINEILKEKGIKIANLQANGGVAALLINGDKEQQQMSCAVYLATSLFEPMNNGAYFTKKLVKQSVTKEKKDSGWDFWNFKKSDEAQPEKEQVVFNQQQFLQDAQIKMAIVQATAQMYAVIAENIQKGNDLYWADYQQRIANIVDDYAPEYLRKVSVFYKNNAVKPLQLVNISLSSFTVTNNSGDVLAQQAGNVMLTNKGVIWFGNGKILGKDYFSQVIAINDVLPKIPSQGAPTRETVVTSGDKNKK